MRGATSSFSPSRNSTTWTLFLYVLSSVYTYTRIKDLCARLAYLRAYIRPRARGCIINSRMANRNTTSLSLSRPFNTHTHALYSPEFIGKLKIRLGTRFNTKNSLIRPRSLATNAVFLARAIGNEKINGSMSKIETLGLTGWRFEWVESASRTERSKSEALRAHHWHRLHTTLGSTWFNLPFLSFTVFLCCSWGPAGEDTSFSLSHPRFLLSSLTLVVVPSSSPHLCRTLVRIRIRVQDTGLQDQLLKMISTGTPIGYPIPLPTWIPLPSLFDLTPRRRISSGERATNNGDLVASDAFCPEFDSLESHLSTNRDGIIPGNLRPSLFFSLLTFQDDFQHPSSPSISDWFELRVVLEITGTYYKV